MKSIKIKTKMIIFILVILAMTLLISGLLIREMIEQGDSAINNLDSQIHEDFDKNIKQQVENANSMLQAVYDGYVRGEYTLDEAKVMGANLLRNLSYGDGGYFYADTVDGTCVVLLGKETEGTNRLNAQDKSGKLYIQEMKKQGMKDGGGYTDLMFPKPNESEPSPKRNYTLHFKPFDWIVGTGNYVDDIDTLIAKEKAKLKENIMNTTRNTIILLILFIIVIIALSIAIINAVIKPIRKLIDVMDEISQGNLDVYIDDERTDEVGQLAISIKQVTDRLKTYIDYIDEISVLLQKIGNGDLNLSFKHSYDGQFKLIKESLIKSSENLNYTLSEFNTVAEEITNGSEQVSVGAQELSNGVTEQASSIEELSAIVDEVSQRIKQLSEDAEKAKGTTEESTVAVINGQNEMESVIKAMEEISESSRGIEIIIKNIEDIAFQTNILALNAAVEAARAGVSGKGFAVVADEVRNLAGKSAESAKNTSVLIESVIDAVNNGTKIVSAAEESLKQIVGKNKQTTDIVKNIAQESVAQARSFEHINIGFEQISTVVQNNSATAQESAAASEELHGQAQILKDLIKQFKLKEEI